MAKPPKKTPPARPSALPPRSTPVPPGSERMVGPEDETPPAGKPRPTPPPAPKIFEFVEQPPKVMAGADVLAKLDKVAPQLPSLGRIVHYRLAKGEVPEEQVGQVRMAFVIGIGAEPMRADLLVVRRARKDRVRSPQGHFVNTGHVSDIENVPFGDGPGQWCWPPRV